MFLTCIDVPSAGEYPNVFQFMLKKKKKKKEKKLGFPGVLAGKESTCNEEDLGSIPGLGRSPGEGNTYPSSILAWRSP